jgi:hypothetical protein
MDCNLYLAVAQARSIGECLSALRKIADCRKRSQPIDLSSLVSDEQLQAAFSSDPAVVRHALRSQPSFTIDQFVATLRTVRFLLIWGWFLCLSSLSLRVCVVWCRRAMTACLFERM